MFNRRDFVSTLRATTATTIAAMGLVALVGCASSPSHHAEVMDRETQRAMTPDDVLAELRAGNDRFVRGESRHRDSLAQAERTAVDGQYPKAIVLSCLDSRVIPETVFDQGIGDIFVGRVAGNFENDDQLGSMEFGTKVAGAKLIVVMGHTNCGAVMGAIDRAELGLLTGMLTNIEPAVESARQGSAGRTSSDAAFVDRVVETNVRQTVSDITARSAVLRDLVRDGDLKVVGAVYDIRTGRVRWIDM